jgi:hypothetical protein
MRSLPIYYQKRLGEPNISINNDSRPRNEDLNLRPPVVSAPALWAATILRRFLHPPHPPRWYPTDSTDTRSLGSKHVSGVTTALVFTAEIDVLHQESIVSLSWTAKWLVVKQKRMLHNSDNCLGRLIYYPKIIWQLQNFRLKFSGSENDTTEPLQIRRTNRLTINGNKTYFTTHQKKGNSWYMQLNSYLLNFMCDFIRLILFSRYLLYNTPHFNISKQEC